MEPRGTERPLGQTENTQTMSLERIIEIAMHTRSLDNLHNLRHELLRRSANHSDGDPSLQGIDPAVRATFEAVKASITELQAEQQAG